MGPKYPSVQVKLVGEDSNAFAIMGRCKEAVREEYRGDREEANRIVKEFNEEATKGDYGHLLCTVMDFFSVDEEDEEEDDWEEDEEEDE